MLQKIHRKRENGESGFALCTINSLRQTYCKNIRVRVHRKATGLQEEIKMKDETWELSMETSVRYKTRERMPLNLKYEQMPRQRCEKRVYTFRNGMDADKVRNDRKEISYYTGTRYIRP